MIECRGKEGEVKVINFKLDRPILPYCPLHPRGDSPTDARLGGAEVKWRDERIPKHTLRADRHHTASAGQDLAVELIPVPGPSGAPLGVDHTFAQTTKGVAEAARRSGNEIGSRGGGAIRANHSRDTRQRAVYDRPLRYQSTVTTTLLVCPGSVRLKADDPVRRELQI